jgi:glutathione synthase/RimK-type ligase-like ATP-grasp enzyme
MLKSGEYGRLDAAGFPVPKWAVITPETKLDPDEWGPYVVEKPDFGGLGAYVRIKRTMRVKFRPPKDFESGHFGRKAAMLAQEFIYTGEWPESFRVMTLLGQTILCRSQKTVGRGHPLSGRWSFGTDGGGSIVSNTKGMTVTMVKDAEIIELCERAHREAFPDIPLLGFDVIRDAESGRLYILECHTHGPSWSFSSSKGSGIQEANRLDFESQYDAFRKCARILAEATPRLAARRLPFQSLDQRWT